MELYLLAKYVHVLGAAALFGTGLGIAFFMLMADRQGTPELIAGVVRIVVIADFLFTATAVIVQPLSGLSLAFLMGYDLREGWIVVSILLYLLIGAFWLPVVWLQIRIKDMAEQAVREGTPLPPRYRHFMRIWFWCGWPAFLSILVIFYLMIAKPDLW